MNAQASFCGQCCCQAYVPGGLICVVRIGLTRIFGNVEIPIPWLWMTAAAAAVGVVLTALSLYGFGKERQEELFEGIRRESV